MYRPSGRSVTVVFEMWPRGAMVAIIATAMPSPTRQCSPLGGRLTVAAAQRCLGQVEALVEPVAAVDEVVLRFRVRDQQRVAVLDRVDPAEFERVDPEA